MPDITFKCPSCGGYLNFDPESQQWKCPFCAACFSEPELREKDTKAQAEAKAEGTSQVVYHCPSCGSEIVTDETTVATYCYYCHSPVVLQGKLQDSMRPDYVLPFQYNKEAAIEQFMAWAKKKRFIPKSFFSREQVATMTGVYYPHFIAEATVDGHLTGTARKEETIPSPRFIDTYIHHFQVERRGILHFRNLMRPALKSTNRKLSDGIHPFPLEDLKPFSGAFLSGFLAERRDLEASGIQQDVINEITANYVKPMLEKDMDYTSTSTTVTADLQSFNTRYVLLPTWVLTYPNPAKPEEPYYYVMNGVTGKVCGKLPIHSPRLFGVSILSGLIALIPLLLFFYFLF